MDSNERSTLYVNFNHVFTFKHSDIDLATYIIDMYFSVQPALQAAVFRFCKFYIPEYAAKKKSDFYVSFYGMESVGK